MRHFYSGIVMLYTIITSVYATKNPVIVVAGMAGPGFVYEILAHRLRNDGYTTFIYRLPSLGFGDIHASAAAFGNYVDEVVASTHSNKIDIVAHSEGGLVSRDYVKNFGGDAKVDKVITLGSPAYGSKVAKLASFITIGTCMGLPACNQMQPTSTYLDNLNANTKSVGHVRYWAFATKYDEFVQPYSNALLPNHANIKNIVIQDQCRLRIVGHLGLIFDGVVYSGVRQALKGRKDINLDCWSF